MLGYVTHVMLCYITHGYVMLYNTSFCYVITHDMLCYITHDYVMLYNSLLCYVI